MLALLGDVANGAANAVGGEANPRVVRVTGLAAGFLARAPLDGGPGGVRGVGRRGQGGVAGVTAEALLQVANAGFEAGDPLEQFSDGPVAFKTALARGWFHVASVGRPDFLARQRMLTSVPMNGYV
jgi:hypothetical protein